MAVPHLLFVTGKLAEPALRRTLADLAPRAGFDFSVAVLPITVAALANTAWIARHLQAPAGIDRVIVPGLCGGELDVLSKALGTLVERGPADLRDLPEHFQTARCNPASYGKYDVEILAEINHAPRLSRDELLRQARRYRGHGADVVDLGCNLDATWSGVGDAVRALRDEGMRVSIDSFNVQEIAAAVAAGAELVLSVNGTNLEAARDWGCEVVAIPDNPKQLDSLDRTVESLTRWNVPFRIDPILEPIGLGFAASLGRYLEVRRRFPDAAMMMGVGNLTELTDVDSAGVNVLLLGFCQELGVRSVLTTEVINWCRGSVREIDLARRLMFHAMELGTVPKRIEPNLVMLRDPKLREHGDEALADLARSIADRNFRLFAERGQIHVLNDQMHLRDSDPFVLFEQMRQRESIDPSHAFYLGYEMAKAVTALTLGKNYAQDQALHWGALTVPETSHRNRGENA